MASPRNSQTPNLAPPPARVSFAPEDRVAGGGSLHGSGDGFSGAPDKSLWMPYDYGDAHAIAPWDKKEREKGFSVVLGLHFPPGTDGDEEFWDRQGVLAGGKRDRSIDSLGGLSYFWPSNEPDRYTWVPPRHPNGDWNYDDMDGDEEAMLAAGGRYLLPAPLPNGEHQNPAPSVLNSCQAALFMDALERAGYPRELVIAAMQNSCDSLIFAGAAEDCPYPWSASWGRITNTELKRLSGIENRKQKTGSEMAKGQAKDEKDSLVPLSVTMEATGGAGKAKGGAAAGSRAKVGSSAGAGAGAVSVSQSASDSGSDEFDPADEASVETLKGQIIEWLSDAKDGSMPRALLGVKLAQKLYKSNQQPVTKWISDPKNLATIDGIEVSGPIVKLAG